MEMLNNIFVSREIALKLKEIGFYENCIAFYDFEGNLSTIIKGQEALLDEYVKGTFTVSSYAGIACPSYEQVLKWFISKGFYFSYSYNHNEDNFYNVIHIEKNFYDNSDEDSDGHYYYDKSGSVCGSYELLRDVIIETAIKMYNVYLLEEKKTYLCKKDEELWVQQPKKQQKPQG